MTLFSLEANLIRYLEKRAVHLILSIEKKLLGKG
jgi:hypothetical protein